MPYVHLSNGQVRDLSDEDWDKAVNESGTPNAYREDGKEFQVIGVYGKEYEHPASPEVQAEKDKEDAENRAEFDKWRAAQRETQSASTRTSTRQGDTK